MVAAVVANPTHSTIFALRRIFFLKFSFLRYYLQIVGWHFNRVQWCQTCGFQLAQHRSVILISQIWISLTQARIKRLVPSAGQDAAAHKRAIQNYDPPRCQRFGNLVYQGLLRSITDQMQQVYQ